MKILHCCLSNYYVDNFNYQENVLPLQNKIDGNEVLILASTEIMTKESRIKYIKPSRYINEYGIEVIRIPYWFYLPKFFIKKFRAYKGTIKYITDFKPNIIMFHGTAAYEITRIAKYKLINPNVKLYIDSHSDFNNSARNFISREILHKIFYRKFLKKALPYIDKIFCISIECYKFMEKFYKIPKQKLEIYPLGGVVFEESEYNKKRQNKRTALGINNNDILFIHAGKLNRKKNTATLLMAFSKVSSDKFKLLLIGSISKNIKSEILKIIKDDPRINFIGWKSPAELSDYLCAADMYLQPGSQSIILQTALCCRCPVMLYPHESHRLYLKGNGFYVKTINEMIKVFKIIEKDNYILKEMSKVSYKIACDLLDYKKLATRLYK
jgi:glycosyltransferase involved in cell wall biosynthesis